MTYRQILKWPHSKLSKPTTAVTDCQSTSTKNLVIDLIDTCNVEYGAGLAANQIGAKKRVLVIKPSAFDFTEFVGSQYNDKYLVLINPSITCSGETTIWKEGCLSFDNVSPMVKRYETVVVHYLNEEGEEKSFEAPWPFSAGLQHECDHLDGITFEKRMKKLARTRMMDRIRKKAKFKSREEKRKKRERKHDITSGGSIRPRSKFR